MGQSLLYVVFGWKRLWGLHGRYPSRCFLSPVIAIKLWGLHGRPWLKTKLRCEWQCRFFFLPCYLLQIVSLSAFPCLFLKMNTGFGLYFFLLFFSFWFGFNAQGCCMRFGWKALFRIDLYISVLSLPLLGEFGFGVLRTRFPPHIFRVGSSRPNVLLLWAILKERRRVVVEEIAAWRCFGKKSHMYPIF